MWWRVDFRWWRYDRKRCKNSHIGYSTARASHFLGHLFAATELLWRELSYFQDFGRIKTRRDHFLFLLSFVLECGSWELNFREKTFFAKLGSVLLFNSLFSNSAPTLRLHIPRSSCGVRRSTFRQVYCYFLCSTDTPKHYSKYLRMIAWSNLQSSVCIFLGSCRAILGHFL